MLSDPDCVGFLQSVLPRLGLRWPGFRKVRKQVCKRIGRRLQELGLERLEDYRIRLETVPEEWTVLETLCRVSISRFYRDRGVFDLLGSEVLPALARLASERGEQELRCWSAGCASGEEAYTLKLLWEQTAEARFPELRLRVLGTDADEGAIERARRGCYAWSSLEELPAGWLDAGFARAGELWCVEERLRDGVEFRVQDLRRALPEERFHLVACRYLVFTYFDEALQRATLTRLAERMLPGAVLVLGSIESLPEPPAVRLVEWRRQGHVYRLEGC